MQRPFAQIFAPALLTLGALIPVDSAATPTFTKIVESGEPVPGATGGEVFAWLSGHNTFTKAAPRIDDQGRVSISGGWTSPTSGSGLFEYQSGTASPIVVVGDPAPSTPNDFVGFPIPFTVPAKLSALGCIFDGSADTFGDLDGVWGNRFGAIEKIVLPQDHPAGTAATARFFNWSHRFVGNGVFVLSSSYTVPGTPSVEYEGFWRDSFGSLDKVIVGRDPAPGAGAGVIFGILGGQGNQVFDTWGVNAQGHVAFKAHIRGSGVTATNDEGVWFEDATGLHLLVREGDAVAPVPGATFASTSGLKTFDDATVLDLFRNDADHIAFGAQFDIPGVGIANGVFSTRSGALELLLMGAGGGLGDPAPGFTNGETFVSFNAAIMSSTGQLAFNGFVSVNGSPSGNWGTFAEQAGSLVYVMKAGDPAGSLPNTTFRSGRVPIFLHLSDSDELFLKAETSSPAGFGTGLFAKRVGEAIRCIVASGQTIEVAPGDVREVSLVVPGSDLSPTGEIPVHISFTDGSDGIYLVGDPVVTAAPVDHSRLLRRVGPNVPNPFNPATRIPYELSGRGYVEITVYDVAGRLLRTLVSETQFAGSHEVLFDGRDDRGRSLASGSYFARVLVGGEARTLKLALIK